jgi:hypothetical protein
MDQAPGPIIAKVAPSIARTRDSKGCALNRETALPIVFGRTADRPGFRRCRLQNQTERLTEGSQFVP